MVIDGILMHPQVLARVQRALCRNGVVSLIGPRQVGKTTLARLIGLSRLAQLR